jgi:hypothetical protein
MSVRRSEELLNNLVGSKVLTKEGKEWLIAAIDPFHDTEIKCSGYPDTNIGQSVVQCVKQTAVLTCPSTITGNWDCMIYSAPVWTDTPLNTATNPGGNILFQPPIPILSTLAPINYCSAASGVDSFNAANSVNLFDLSAYDTGVSRVISQGFEVTNTTAEIYKQGQAIAFRVPQPVGVDADYTIAGVLPGSMLGSGSLRTINSQPSSSEHAMLLSGSKQWAAAEGAYIPLVLNTPDVPAESSTASGIIFENNTAAGAGTVVCSLIANSVSTGLLYFATPQKHTQFHTGGVLFQGLSNQSSLQVTYIAYIERFPSPENSLEADLVVLATPSPEYDIMALELYSQCISRMPVGVMVKENGLGDWFKGAVEKVTSIAAPVLGMIPHPAAQGLAIAARGVNQAVNYKKFKPQAQQQFAQQQPMQYLKAYGPSQSGIVHNNLDNCAEEYDQAFRNGRLQQKYNRKAKKERRKLQLKAVRANGK